MVVLKTRWFYSRENLIEGRVWIGIRQWGWWWPRLWKPKWKQACGHQCCSSVLCKVQNYSPLLIFCMMLLQVTSIWTFPSGVFPKILCLVQFCKATKSWVFLPVPVSCTRTVHFKHMTRASERQLRINMWQLLAPEDTGFDDWWLVIRLHMWLETFRSGCRFI